MNIKQLLVIKYCWISNAFFMVYFELVYSRYIFHVTEGQVRSILFLQIFARRDVYRSAKFDAKLFNFFACLFILFYRSPMYETFWTESKIK